MKKRRNSHIFVFLTTVSHFTLLTSFLIQLFRHKSYICAVIGRQDNWCLVECIFKMAKRRADVALSKKLDIFKNYICSQHVDAEQLNISLDKMHEFEKLNGHVRQFLRHQQPMRQLTLDVFAWKWMVFHRNRQRELLVTSNCCAQR